jgi:hypothetical protein
MYSDNGNANNIASINYATSSDKGATWSQWQVLSDGNFDAREASVVADPSGKIYVAWREPIVANGPSQIVFRVFNNGQWSAASVIAPSTNFQFFPSIGVDNSGNAYVAWMETGDASGFPHEDPQTGSGFVAFMKNGTFQAPVPLGPSGSTDLYPNVPLHASDINHLPVLFEEQAAADGSAFTAKLQTVAPAK